MPARVLVINPNTSTGVTDQIVESAAHLSRAPLQFIGATGEFGAPYISSRTGVLIGQMAAMQLLARHHDECDVVWLCCFGDPGLDALREVSPVPVVGLAEPGCLAAAAGGRRFSIVTGGASWQPMLEELTRFWRIDAHLASVRTLARTAGELRNDPALAIASLAETCRACVTEDGAEAVVIGGAGFAGFTDAVRCAAGLPVPIVCPVEEALREIEALIAAPRPSSGGPAVIEVGWKGLTGELGGFLAERAGG